MTGISGSEIGSALARGDAHPQAPGGVEWAVEDAGCARHRRPVLQARRGGWAQTRFVLRAASTAGRRGPSYHPGLVPDRRRRKVVSVVGTRPNFMKIAPIVAAMAAHAEEFTHVLVHTGPHYDYAIPHLLR
jgi:hypothetical protein